MFFLFCSSSNKQTLLFNSLLFSVGLISNRPNQEKKQQQQQLNNKTKSSIQRFIDETKYFIYDKNKK